MLKFLQSLFGLSKKKEGPKKKPSRVNEFSEDEPTMDGVIRKVKSDLYKDNIIKPSKEGSREKKG